MSDPTMRQMAMLAMIPRAPYKTTVRDLQTKLEAKGYPINVRGIQRDLVTLSTRFPLQADESKPQGWSWLAAAPLLDIPALDPQTALTLKLVENYMGQLLPVSTLDYLQPWFHSASGVLEQNGNGLAHWPDKIRVLPRGLPQQAPHIAQEVITAVYQAILQERQLEISYTRNSLQPEPQSHNIHPLALVVRDKVIYLIGVFNNEGKPYQFALHRMLSAQILEAAGQRPASFSIDAYIAESEFGMPYTQTPIKLKAKFLRHVAIHLRETPIADNQVLEDVDDDWVLLSATVANTLELRIWLRSFGDEVEIIKPEVLRQEFCEIAESLYTYYRNTKE